jgi:hypothetical protein
LASVDALGSEVPLEFLAESRIPVGLLNGFLALALPGWALAWRRHRDLGSGGRLLRRRSGSLNSLTRGERRGSREQKHMSGSSSSGFLLVRLGVHVLLLGFALPVALSRDLQLR